MIRRIRPMLQLFHQDLIHGSNKGLLKRKSPSMLVMEMDFGSHESSQNWSICTTGYCSGHPSAKPNQLYSILSGRWHIPARPNHSRDLNLDLHCLLHQLRL